MSPITPAEGQAPELPRQWPYDAVYVAYHRWRQLHALDWVKALTLFNIKRLDEKLVQETLSTLMKYEGDIRKAQEEMKAYIAERKAQLHAPQAAGAESDKDLLH
mgnify:CR=1 FL=1